MMQQKTLTKGEMQVMNILWDMQRGACIAEIQKQYPEPHPAYTTIATFLKIMEQKGFVEKRKSGSGKTFVYSPLLTRERYRRLVVDDVKDTFFGGSVKSLVSFFAEEEELSLEDINEILTILQNRKHVD
ncbi:MAG: BlaI/MecI/CopY family transcriptional regulator [Prevotella sp.]|nr:BlaI/MecI/CopY family transcriptional regulator [Prevotella sp.]MBQ1588377.1 BlaI/MecI/CopY family transcriptional regulator [Prevotella sp.]MBQ1702779.1 BlaI/MecI/CopY family transcriptional regulator [Prevotella sp.]MBQ1760103.1 BlaI/MecI/CopY family transcriptional regulator [Prevotella sp.]MBQ2170035.1 BlaI/MecI/CopY family transcriptional regulator [Prevotella sp.]